MCGAIRHTYGRHTGGEAQRRISMPYLYCPSNGWMSERVQGRQSIPFVVHDAGTDRCETGIITGPRVSTICLPDVIAHDQISHALIPPPYLHTASDQILAVGMPGNEANSLLFGRKQLIRFAYTVLEVHICPSFHKYSHCLSVAAFLDCINECCFSTLWNRRIQN